MSLLTKVVTSIFGKKCVFLLLFYYKHRIIMVVKKIKKTVWPQISKNGHKKNVK